MATTRSMRALVWIGGAIAVLGAACYIAFQVSPWPAALLIRRAFEQDGRQVSQALAQHVPAGVAAQLNERYDRGDPDARLDVFYPAELAQSGGSRLTVVWVHGGGWIAGSKDEIANYARILAGNGYTVVGVDYSLAPAHVYPTPVRQINAALSFLQRQAGRLHVDPSRFVLAGDSGGAHIVAQVANVISSPQYARQLGIVPAISRPQLVGLILFCGPYDTRHVKLDGAYGGFLRTVLWSYSGSRDFLGNPTFATASVIDYLTAEFPPSFISVGNADPLAPHSYALADALARRGVQVDTLFFPRDHLPALPHEYQFNLDTDAGRLALERSLAFLANR